MALAIAMLATVMTGAASAATVFTGDTIDGKRVVTNVDLADLPVGKHSFYFRGVQMGTGQYWYVPVVIAKGAQPGKRVLLTAGIHGDEISSMESVRQVMAALDPAAMSGSVIAAYGVSRASIERVQREWPTVHSMFNLNRAFPGNPKANNPAGRHADLIWKGLFQPNTDVSIDFHTQMSGSAFADFIYADLRKPEVRTMVSMFPIAQVKNDTGEPGTLETTFVSAGIPSATLELGGPRIYDNKMIALFTEGTLNVLKYYKVVPGPMGRTAKDANTFIADNFSHIRTSVGGFLDMKVGLKDKVVPGQVVAIQRNAFGEIVAELKSTVAGEVAVIQEDAMIEPGGRVMTILYNGPDAACPSGPCPDDEDE
jgi:predicted deacylase